jgi:hypothetical protein
MKEDDPAAFGLLIDWLFRSDPRSEPVLLDDQSGKVSGQELSQMCKLFVLADRIGECNFASKIHCQIYELLLDGHNHISTELVNICASEYFNTLDTLDTSRLRAILIELAAEHFNMKDTKDFEQWVEVMCSNSTFNREVTKEVRKRSSHRCEISRQGGRLRRLVWRQNFWGRGR